MEPENVKIKRQIRHELVINLGVYETKSVLENEVLPPSKDCSAKKSDGGNNANAVKSNAYPFIFTPHEFVCHANAKKIPSRIQ